MLTKENGNFETSNILGINYLKLRQNSINWDEFIEYCANRKL